MILGFPARAGLLIASLFVTAGTAAAETAGAETRTPSAVTADAPPHAAVTVDHHVHVHSPAILDFLPKYCGSEGRIGPCPEVFMRAYSPEDLIAEMDAAGIGRSLVMSTGYLAESPMMQPALPEAPKILRAANEWSAELATRYPGRFGIYIGINPVSSSALPEMAHFARDPRVTGIKIHVTNSDANLRDRDNVAKLASVFEMAHRTGLAVMIHMRTRAEDYGARDVETFVRDVLPQAGDTPVQIAHAAGWGGIDAPTLSALGAFAAAIETDRDRFAHVTFDLAAVWDEDTAAEDLEALAALIRRIGPEHFVAASDFPFVGHLADYYAKVYPRLPLTCAEWTAIRTNTPGYDSVEYAKERIRP
ncbi:amidohydrolase family protein [Novosphingobium sp. BW1]|uniref:amidohydrolase family protein n=1 Tax=Novosphingobium sp. BW1 TaxID=2592621 RepID=UPI001F071EE0|nr:amidohydrolase family protein [Novosphingobium sp. BW1]